MDQKTTDACYRCGYNLTSIADDQPCPECGLLAERSRRPSERLRDGRPEYLGKLSQGTSLIFISIVGPIPWLLFIPLVYVVLCSIVPFNIMDRVAYILYGDSTLTGRTIIWAFAQYEIGRRPIAGWGYQSFWLVPGSPTVTDAPGWVKMMPNAHNGYYDTMLETGYVGLALLLAFIVATLHGIGRLANQDPTRARTVLSLALFVICYNYFETLWLRGFEFLWLVFLILAADVGRYWQPTRRGGVVGVAPARPGRQAHQLRMRLS